MKKSNTKFICSIVLKLLVVLCVTIGLASTFSGEGFMRAAGILFFTIQSNIWIGAICLIFAAIQIAELVQKRKILPNWLYVLKFMFTAAITLTFIVMTCMLTPNMIMQGQYEYLASANNVFCHYLSPVLAIIDFVLFDTEWKNKWVEALTAVIMPIYYLIFALVLGSQGVVFGENGDTFPYFFLDQSMGWFSGANPSGKYGPLTFGVFWWIIILTVFVICMGFAYLAINRAMKKTAFARLPFLPDDGSSTAETIEAELSE